MKRILEEIEKTFTARRVLIVFILVVVFFAKEIWIVSIIDKVLLVPKDFSNPVLDVLFIIASYLDAESTKHLIHKLIVC